MSTPRECCKDYLFAKIKGVRVETVRDWTNSGKLEFVTTEGEHRRYPIEQFLAQSNQESRITILYARVSSHDQKEDLERQCQVLQSLYPDAELIKDLGSGLNYKKKGLTRIITLITQGLVAELVITHKDRFLRFGSELIFSLYEQFGTKVTILNQPTKRVVFPPSTVKQRNSTLPNIANSFVLVGSKDESSGNQLAQFDYVEKTDSFVLSIRTPYALEERLGGDYIRIDGLRFKHGKHEIVESISERCYKVKTKDGTEKWAIGCSAVTLRFYWKDDCWYIAATTDVYLPEITSEYLSGYVGVDLNADSIGWAVCNAQGNLLEYGNYKLDLHSKTANQREAILCDAANFIALKAKQYNFPIASEKLDFSAKKRQLKEKGKKYARMLSTLAYSQWNEALDNACQKHGIYHKKVNPAYSSLVGLTKFMSMYGMNSASSFDTYNMVKLKINTIRI